MTVFTLSQEFRAELERAEEILTRMASHTEAMRRLDTMMPGRIETVRVEHGQNVQSAFDRLLAGGGVLELGPGLHDQVLHRTCAEPKLLLVKGVGPDSRLKGFFAPPSTHNVHFENLAFSDPLHTGYTHVRIGEGREPVSETQADGTVKRVWRHVAQPSRQQTPTGFQFRRIIGMGGCKKGIIANCGDFLLEDSELRDYMTVGADSIAVGGYNGCFNHVIRRNILGAASENILYGGADFAYFENGNSEDMMPQDILIEANELYKLKAWDNTGVNVKCLFELKNAKRVEVLGNKLRGCWADAQSGGTAFLLKSANQEGTNPTARIEDIVLRGNIAEDVGEFVRIIGRNDAGRPSGIAKNLVILHNICASMHGEGSGQAFVVYHGPEGVSIRHNTTRNRRTFLETDGEPETAVEFTDNIVQHGLYGLRNLNGAPLVLTYNAVEIDPRRRVSLPTTNVYYPDVTADLSVHETSDGVPVGAQIP